MEALGWPFLLFLWLSSAGSSAPAAAPPPPRRRRPLPSSPSPAPSAQAPAALPAALPAATTPWPQVVPAGLPPFPGSGWEYDEPPPPAVVQRAQQLVSQLWKGGRGTFVIEQTAGRWIAYQAAPTSVPRGVVAYREKRAAALPGGPGSAPSSAQRPPSSAPAATPVMAPAASPGPRVPSSAVPAPDGGVVDLQTLRRGMGVKPSAPLEDVRVAQRKLIAAGVESAAHFPVDGAFGKDTEKAAKKFQKRNGLVDDGVIGPITWAKLLAVDSVRS